MRLALLRSDSDWYVISSFLFAFSIIFAQTLAELGIYDEEEGAFLWSGRERPSASENASASDFDMGATGPADEEVVTIPAPLVYGVCVW